MTCECIYRLSKICRLTSFIDANLIIPHKSSSLAAMTQVREILLRTAAVGKSRCLGLGTLRMQMPKMMLWQRRNFIQDLCLQLRDFYEPPQLHLREPQTGDPHIVLLTEAILYLSLQSLVTTSGFEDIVNRKGRLRVLSTNSRREMSTKAMNPASGAAPDQEAKLVFSVIE